MECPTPCVCGEIGELHDMFPIRGRLPDGGNLVCESCLCKFCDGDGNCPDCEHGECPRCGRECATCKNGDCPACDGRGYAERRASGAGI